MVSPTSPVSSPTQPVEFSGSKQNCHTKPSAFSTENVDFRAAKPEQNSTATMEHFLNQHGSGEMQTQQSLLQNVKLTSVANKITYREKKNSMLINQIIVVLIFFFP